MSRMPVETASRRFTFPRKHNRPTLVSFFGFSYSFSFPFFLFFFFSKYTFIENNHFFFYFHLSFFFARHFCRQLQSLCVAPDCGPSINGFCPLYSLCVTLARSLSPSEDQTPGKLNGAEFGPTLVPNSNESGQEHTD